MTTELKSVLGGIINVTYDERNHPKFYELSGGNVEQENRNLLPFQSGNPATVGLNGFTFEDLLAVMQHRMSFSNADYPSPFNVIAMQHMAAAQKVLDERFQITTAARDTDLTQYKTTYVLDRDDHKIVYCDIPNIAFEQTGHFIIIFCDRAFYGRTLAEVRQAVKLANYIEITRDTEYWEELSFLKSLAIYSETNPVDSFTDISTSAAYEELVIRLKIVFGELI